MRAAVVESAGRVELAEVEPPEPGPGEIRIRVEGCGVCGSDLPLYEGRAWFEYPREPGAPGHEGWGVVDAVAGDGAPERGTRVAALSYRAYADYDVARADAVVPLPAALDGLPFPGEALGCAVNVFRRSDVQSDHRVAVVGVGFLGALLVQLAATSGAHVVALSRREASRETARRMGATEAAPLDAAPELGEFDRVIEAAGKQETLDIAGRLTRTRGRLVIAGFHQDGARTVDMQLWNWRGLDVVNAHERDQVVYLDGIRKAVGLVAEGRIDPMPLYTHVFPLDAVGDALATAAARPDDFMKAIVVP